MSFFTKEYRSDVLKHIIDYLKNDDDILSIIIVGSGANGFRDIYSDIDLTVVIDNKTNIDTFLLNYQLYLDDNFDVMINHRVPGRPLAIAMLDNFLEIDISAVYLDQLFAIRNNWNVVFDKTEQAENIMKKTFNSGLSVDLSERIDNEFQNVSWGFWHYIIYATIAIKRNDLWRANWEMEYLRNSAIQLLGFKYGVETKRNRDVKLFPTETLKRLQNTFSVGFTQRDYLVALKNLCNLIYDIFDEHSEETAIEFPREKMAEFISYIFER